MRSARWALIAVVALLSFGCGGDDGGEGDMGSAGTGGGVCGDGIVDQALGEACEPTIPVTATCGVMNLGIGVVRCTMGCQYDVTMCGPAMAPVAGNGGGGTGG